MQDPLQIPLQRLAATIQALRPQLVDAIGTEALVFINSNFQAQGYNGRTFIPWPARSIKDKEGSRRALLIKTGTLRRSIIKTDSADYTTISTDIPYARVHNEGSRNNMSRSRMGTFGKPFYQNIPQRQFMPITSDDAPILVEKCHAVIIRKITENIKL